MKWTIAKARTRFSELLRSAAREPQPVYNRDRVAGVVVDPETFKQFADWRARQKLPSLADAFEGLRALCRQERYELDLGERKDRRNSFAAIVDDASR